MDDGGPTATILFILLVLIDMFYYGFSATLDQLNVKEIERKAQEEKDKRSIRLLSIIKEPDCYINTSHLIVTMVHVIVGCVYMNTLIRFAKGVLGKFVEETLQVSVAVEILAILAAVLTFAVILYILLTFGISLPKRIVLENPQRWAYAFINVVYVINHIALPFTGLVSLTTRGILKIFGLKAEKDDGDVTEEEIIDMVNEGHEQGLIQASEAEMISNIFEYGDKEAQDIMTHRNNIIALDGSMLLSDAIDFVLDGKQSRYPVYEENIDHIIGILHLKDVLRYHADNDKLSSPICSLPDLLREPEYIPLTRNIDELFKDMQSKKLQMVIVVDEYGQTAGLVAMEDILEEIVGNIMDEYDEEVDYIEEKGKDEYIIEGKTPLEELEERFQISFHEQEYETLNGFLISKMDKIPEENEQFEIVVDGYLFKIQSVENKMIHSVLVTRLPDKEVSNEEESVLEEKEE